MMPGDNEVRRGLAWAQLLVANAAEEPPDFLYPRRHPVSSSSASPKTTVVGLGTPEDIDARKRARRGP